MTESRHAGGSPATADCLALPMFAAAPGGTGPQQLTYGERAAIDGVLSQLRPELAIEIGTAEGGTLRRIAAHSREVHSFDIVEPPAPLRQLANVVFHRGDSHVQLVRVLSDIARAGRNVDFVFVDGDHSADGVAQDVSDLISSDAVGESVILIHDTINDGVRQGLGHVLSEVPARVVHLDLDFVPGRLARSHPYSLQAWGGIGLLLTTRASHTGGKAAAQRAWYDAAALMKPVRAAMERLEATGTPLEDLDPRMLEAVLTSYLRRRTVRQRLQSAARRFAARARLRRA